MSDSTQRQRLEQGRAKHAYDAAKAAADAKVKDYKSYTKKVPMLVKSNGLGATLAYMQSKGKAYETIIKNIEGWLNTDDKFKDIYKNLEGKTLVEKVVNCSSQEYRALTIEILAYLNWLKRFADGLIND